MKKTILVFVGIIALSFVVEKEYVVKYELNSWASKVNTLQVAAQALKQSDLPAKQVNPVADSLTKFAQEIINQVNPQVVDTTENKK
jgi:hypothetical protein